MPPRTTFPPATPRPPPARRLAAEVERRLVYVRAMRGLARRPALTRVAAVVAEVAAEVGGKPPAPGPWPHGAAGTKAPAATLPL